MGWTFSPYSAVKYYYLAEEFIRGNPHDESRPMGWSEVKLNLPGDETYDPTLPLVMKWNTLFNNIAGDIKAFVDDLRASGYSEEHAWQVA